MSENSNSTLSEDNNELLDQIPVLHVRGTHFQVGYTIGRQFRSLVEEIINWNFLNEILIPTHGKLLGKQIYDTTLELCQRKFPNYIAELEGMGKGANIPFDKLFLMHLGSVIVPPNTEYKFIDNKEMAGIGCTSVICNSEEILLGHTEDTVKEFGNNVYIIAAEILDDKGETLEKFTTLTYAGHLPGYTMGFNSHGMIYSVNTLYPLEFIPGNTPRTFLTRAILGAANMAEVVNILRDFGTGTSDGFSLNITFVTGESECIWKNIEVAPPDGTAESELSIFTLPSGDCYAHCNRYIRLQCHQTGNPEFNSSSQRLKAIEKHEKPNTIEILKTILSDRSDQDYPIFRTGKKPDLCKTIATGIFDVKNRKWLIYTKPPAESNPVAVLPMDFVFK